MEGLIRKDCAPWTQRTSYLVRTSETASYSTGITHCLILNWTTFMNQTHRVIWTQHFPATCSAFKQTAVPFSSYRCKLHACWIRYSFCVCSRPKCQLFLNLKLSSYEQGFANYSSFHQSVLTDMWIISLLCYDRFLPNPFQVIIYRSFHIFHCLVCDPDSS